MKHFYKKLNLTGFLTGLTLIEMLMVILIIGVTLTISTIKINSYVEGLRLKQATQDLIQDLQLAQEGSKSGTGSVTVIFGVNAGTYTGTYTVIPEIITIGTYTVMNTATVAFENPIWLSNTEEKRDMSKFHLMPDIPLSVGSFTFNGITGFVKTATVISLTLKSKSRYVTVSRLGKVEERK